MKLTDVLREARVLGAGTRTPSLKKALWGAELSTMQRLEVNCRLMNLLDPFVERDLPPQEELYARLKKARAVLFGSHLSALYYTEYLEKSGQLEPFKNLPRGYMAQSAWRDGVLRLMRGHGLSYKTASFAALIYQPTYCELVPVDRHVMKRLNYKTDASPQQKKLYLSIEQEVMRERDEIYPSMPLGLWHWYKWEEFRQTTGASKSDGCETHAGLSCRNY